MNKIYFLLIMAVIYCNRLQAQDEQGVLPPTDAKFETYTDWKEVSIGFDGGEKAIYEYRIALVKRKGLACSYDLQVKNTSDSKMKFKVNSHYFDRLVKGNYGDKYDENIKPGQTTSFIILTQGCKADKDNKDQEDYERCISCGMTYEIKVIKD